MSVRFAHVALNCDDLDAIIKFYCSHLGFEVDRVFDLGDGHRIAFIASGPVHLELFEAAGDRPVPKEEGDGPAYSGLRHIAFQVDDVDSEIERLVAAGAKVNAGPMGFDVFIPGWKSAWLADPEGNVFEISQGYTSGKDA